MKITQACLNRDPRKRPNFEELVRDVAFRATVVIMTMHRRRRSEGYRTGAPRIFSRSTYSAVAVS